MVSTEHLLAFGVAALLLIAIPGPSVVFVIGRALAYGRAVALATVLGNSLGLLVILVLVAGGLGVVVRESIAVFTVLKLLGAAYLLYLGVQAIRHRHVLQASIGTPVAQRSRRRLLLDGILVGAANPKMIVFLTVVMPQFTDPGRGQVWLQMIVLGAFIVAIAIACDSVWAFAAGSARAWFANSPRRLATLGGAGGVAIVGLGVTVAVTGNRPA